MNKRSLLIIIHICVVIALGLYLYFHQTEAKCSSNTNTPNFNSNVNSSINTNGTVSVVKPTIPTIEKECAVQHGLWGLHTGSLQETCILPTTDSTKRCSYSTECQGDCIAASASATYGTCSPTTPVNTSCWRNFEGTAQEEICY